MLKPIIEKYFENDINELMSKKSRKSKKSVDK